MKIPLARQPETKVERDWPFCCPHDIEHVFAI
jgi:hypothetical protein